jgi:hypothetical protein
VELETPGDLFQQGFPGNRLDPSPVVRRPLKVRPDRPWIELHGTNATAAGEVHTGNRIERPQTTTAVLIITDIVRDVLSEGSSVDEAL